MKLLWVGFALLGTCSAGQRPQPPSSRDFEQLRKRAGAAREANRLEEAIGLYRRSLRLNASWAEGWWYLSTLLYEQDRYGEARDTLRRFVALDPKSGPGWAMLGLCEFEVREYERALLHLQRGLAHGLGGAAELGIVARYHAALLLIRSERFEEGIELLFALVREGRESPGIIEAIGRGVLHMPFLPAETPPDKREIVLLTGRAVSYLAGRPRPEARRYFEELTARYPEAPYVHYAYGIFLLPEDADAALREFRRECELSPAHLAARLQIGEEYLRRSEPAPALRYAEEAVKMAPESSSAHRILGRLLLAAGELPRAVQELEVAVRLAPQSAESRYALAMAYAQAGRRQDAAREQAEFSRLKKQGKQK